MFKYLLAVTCCFAVSVTQAEVRVVESSPQSVRSGVNHQQVNQQEVIEQKTEVYNQIQSLQQEVSELRSMLEEQAHEVSRLKQLQLDNYVDLDRRVAILSGAGKTNIASPQPPETSEVTSPALPNTSGLNESDEYKAAYELLRQHQNDEAVTAFKEYLRKYPSGNFAGNSCYWLGKIFILKEQLPQARDWFTKLIEGFPSSNKVLDAKFELGRVYHLLGDKVRAKALLNEAALGAGDSARLAKQYLKDNL